MAGGMFLRVASQPRKFNTTERNAWSRCLPRGSEQTMANGHRRVEYVFHQRVNMRSIVSDLVLWNVLNAWKPIRNLRVLLRRPNVKTPRTDRKVHSPR